MICPAYWRVLPKNVAYTPPVSCPVPYYIKQGIYSDPNNEVAATRIFWHAFGRPNGGNTPPPLLPDGSSPMHKTSEIPKAAEQWAITDDDKKINSGGTYAQWLNEFPSHGYTSGKPRRNALYYDWHVETWKKVYPSTNP